MGTPLYMSPEQWRGEAVDGKTDVYALGAMLYQLLVGQAPFLAANIDELMAMHQDQTPAPLLELDSFIPPALAQLAERMLAKQASHRPEMAEVAARINALSNPFASGPRRVGSPRP